MKKYLEAAPARSAAGVTETQASGTASREGGLLALMKRSREAKMSQEGPATSSSSSSSSPPSQSSFPQWEAISTTQSLSDISYQTKHQRLCNGDKASQRGWRVVDGQKVYVTVRPGGVVRATGKDAFLLSRADEGKTNKGTSQRKNVIGATRPSTKSSSTYTGTSTGTSAVVTTSTHRENQKLTDIFVKNTSKSSAGSSQQKRKRATSPGDRTQHPAAPQSQQPVKSASSTRNSHPLARCDAAGGTSVGDQVATEQQVDQSLGSHSAPRSSSSAGASLFSF
mmetsp:Transcript_28656/g.48363  ORF Transcript_28656/g.48363 Transcript_28656/m.48363 type:complete len:281 (-) Transcript_28656:197-1039(-)